MLQALDERLARIGGNFRVVDGVGRGLVLDRDQNWGNVKRAYDALTDGMKPVSTGKADWKKDPEISAPTRSAARFSGRRSPRCAQD